MYRVSFTFCNNSIGNGHDYKVDLDYQYFDSQDVTYIYKNLDYDMLMDLLKKDINDLHRVKNGEISICLMLDE